MSTIVKSIVASFAAFAAPVYVWASEATTTASSTAAGGHGASEGHGAATLAFVWIVVILLAAKLAGSLAERFKQPSVLGELVAGVVLGNLTLIGITVFEPITSNEIIAFLAELGVIILLFQIGLESNLGDMRRVGVRALMVALVGVALPFALGTYLVGPWLLPELSFNAHLFIGATLTATSVGITARVFKDLGKLSLPEAQTVLGAAVIDDVLGLIILAVVSALVTAGSISAVSVALIALKAFAFLGGSVLVGMYAAPMLGRLFSGVHTGAGMKFTLALVFALVFAYGAQLIGLAAIVGAFAAGLVLDRVHFRHFREPDVVEDLRATASGADSRTKNSLLSTIDNYSHRHVEDLIEPLAHFVVPIFFVVTGMSVDIAAFLDMEIVLVALAVTAIAVIGKVVAGYVSGAKNKALIGWGMVPRGEVGLIFANIGLSIGVISSDVFSIVIVMVILTTLMTPPILAFLLRRAG